MKILYILPNETAKTGGNWITVNRLLEGLRKIGITVEIVEVKNVSEKQLMKYDVIHAFHAFKSFIEIKFLIMKIDKTIVVSFTGTDFKQLQEIEERKTVIDLLNRTQAIIVFHNEAREELIKEGILWEKIRVIPQTSIPMEIKYRQKEQITENLENLNYVTFLFIAGIRKVKAPLEVIEMMTNLEEKVKNIRLVIIGPILDEDLGEKVKTKIKGKEWIDYLGEVSHQKVQDFIFKSQVIINGSISEGMSNTLLEAQQMGKPILATDIAGNRAIVTHGVDGFLFKDKEEFEYYAKKLSLDSNLRKQMGFSALESVKDYDLIQEISLYEKVYSK